jgi:hypothetical protein
MVEPIGSIDLRKISSLCRFVLRFFFQRFFVGHILAHKPSFQLSFERKEDLVVLYILVEVD